MECRLLIVYSGEGLIMRVSMLYNTESNILSLFKKNLAEMATLKTLTRYQFAEVSYILSTDGVISVLPKL